METVYRKIKSPKGRVSYVPCGTDIDVLGDGIWYVHSKPGSRSTTSVEYITNLMKIGDPEKMTVREICGVYDVAETIMQSKELRDLTSRPCSVHDIVVMVVSMLNDMKEGGQKDE